MLEDDEPEEERYERWAIRLRQVAQALEEKPTEAPDGSDMMKAAADLMEKEAKVIRARPKKGFVN